MKRFVKTILRRFGFDLIRHGPINSSELAAITDLSDMEKKIVSQVKPFTMTSVERIAALINAVTYISSNNIPGDIGECGVWRGGSMMAVALTLLSCKDTNRSLYLYDTFEGLPSPTEHDIRWDGISAKSEFEREIRDNGKWCDAGLEDVRINLLSTGYPEAKIHFIKGKVEENIPKIMPPHLALLRLDTDWYESTKHEMIHLFPLLDSKGILIVDDYGCWQGVRKAIDEYFREQKLNVYLHRIDNTGRILVKGGF